MGTYLAHQFPPAVHTQVSATLCSFDPDTTSKRVRLHVKSRCNAKSKTALAPEKCGKAFMQILNNFFNNFIALIGVTYLSNTKKKIKQMA